MPFYVASAMPKASLYCQPAGKPLQMFCTLLVLSERSSCPCGLEQFRLPASRLASSGIRPCTIRRTRG